MISVTDLVARDADDCVASAFTVLVYRYRLGDISQRTTEAAPQLFFDHRPIMALNDLLQTLAENARNRYG